MSRRRGIDGSGPTPPLMGKNFDAPQEPVRAGFQLDKATKGQIDNIIVSAGYGLKGKQRWYRDTLGQFLDPATWHVDRAADPEHYKPWLRVIVDSTFMQSRSADRVNEYMALEHGQWVRAWWTALRAAEYGANMDDPIYLEFAVRHVLRAAVIWGIQQAGVYRVDTPEKDI